MWRGTDKLLSNFYILTQLLCGLSSGNIENKKILVHQIDTPKKDLFFTFRRTKFTHRCDKCDTTHSTQLWLVVGPPVWRLLCVTAGPPGHSPCNVPSWRLLPSTSFWPLPWPIGVCPTFTLSIVLCIHGEQRKFLISVSSFFHADDESKRVQGDCTTDQHMP